MLGNGRPRISGLSNSSTGQLFCHLSLMVLIQRVPQLLGDTSKIYLVEFNFPANVAFGLHPPEGIHSSTDLNTLKVTSTRRSRLPEGLVD